MSEPSASVPSGTFEQGERQAVENCIHIVQQSLDTVRAEHGDDESRTARVSIAAREHVIALLSGYLAALTQGDTR